MQYTRNDIRRILCNIYGYNKNTIRNNAFLWEKEKGALCSDLKHSYAKNKKLLVNNTLTQIMEYCWLVYRKALHSSGKLYVGRQADLWTTENFKTCGIQPEYSAKYAVLHEEADITSVISHSYHIDAGTLWQSDSEGNIQVMDKWSPIINDFWLLGGIHRKAIFHLVSPLTKENLWDSNNSRLVVTAREIFGLLRFGYKNHGKQGSNTIIYRCMTPTKAEKADIATYGLYIEAIQIRGETAVNALLANERGRKNCTTFL